MPICAVVTCKNRSGLCNISRGGISYHRFPRDPTLKAKWTSITGRPAWWNPSITSTICSQHFEPYDFVKKAGERHYLQRRAIPTRFVPLPRVVVPSLTDTQQVSESFSNTSIATQEDNVVSPCNINSRENLDDIITSIEVEIMPENQIFLHPHKMSATEKAQDDRKIIELMRAKIEEQELLIRKLKVRNYRLKKRLFSLKSMES